MIYAHNCGKPSNIHSYNVQNYIKDEDKCTPVSTGPSIATTVGEFKQRAAKYYQDHEYIKTFPPSYYVKSKETQQLVTKLEQHPSFNEGKILVGYNPVKHLQLLGLKDKEIEEIFHADKQTEYDDNTIVCIYPEQNIVFAYVVGSDKQCLAEDVEKLNQLLVTLYHVNHDILQNEHFTMTGIIVLPPGDSEKLKQHPCLNMNEDTKRFVISLDDDFQHWLDSVFKEIKEFCELPTTSHSESISHFIGGLMASMAETKLYLPRVTNNETKIIKTILLNGHQIECINSKSKKKMIRAAFGSGKSVILHEIARKLLKEKNDDLIINITFDPFTALDKKVDQSFDELCKQENMTANRNKLISLSLSDALEGADFLVTDVYNLNSFPTQNIADILLFLKKKYNNKRIHFLMDEVPQELFTKKYCERLSSSLVNAFPDSVVVIALQSVHRSRKIIQPGKEITPDEIDLEPLKSSGMELFELPKTMRMSSTLHKLKKILEDEIEPSPCSVYLEVKTKGIWINLTM